MYLECVLEASNSLNHLFCAVPGILAYNWDKVFVRFLCSWMLSPESSPSQGAVLRVQPFPENTSFPPFSPCIWLRDIQVGLCHNFTPKEMKAVTCYQFVIAKLYGSYSPLRLSLVMFLVKASLRPVTWERLKRKQGQKIPSVDPVKETATLSLLYTTGAL